MGTAYAFITITLCNKILDFNGVLAGKIPLLGFQTNGSGERKIIAEWLEKLVG